MGEGMKKYFIVMMIIWYCKLQAQFISFQDQSAKNGFLSLSRTTCPNFVSKKNSNSYDCGNGGLSGLLTMNFLSAENIGKQFYIFNNFMYWMSLRDYMGEWNGKNEEVEQQLKQAKNAPDQIFSGSGAFMIELGTSWYLQKSVQAAQPALSCPQGKTLLVAQLKYNDGTSIRTWSQDAICLAPQDTFSLLVTSDPDTKFVAASQNLSQHREQNGLILDPGPAENYHQAGNSPRMVKLQIQTAANIGVAQNSVIKPVLTQ